MAGECYAHRLGLVEIEYGGPETLPGKWFELADIARTQRYAAGRSMFREFSSHKLAELARGASDEIHGSLRSVHLGCWSLL